jgi:hypothetical protein
MHCFMVVVFAKRKCALYGREPLCESRRMSEIVATNFDGYVVEAALAAFFRAATQPRVKPRRPRRLSFRQAETQAGRPVASVTDRPDGSRTYAFGQSTASPDAEVNEWDLDLGAPSPPPLRQ